MAPNYGYRCIACGKTRELYVRPGQLQRKPLTFCSAKCSGILATLRAANHEPMIRPRVERSYADWLGFAADQTDRFYSKMDRSGACWLWLCGVDADGYGKFQINGSSHEEPRQKHVRAHRLSYELTHGEIPDGLYVLHKCDTPRCCNPEHLFLGTALDNARDAVAKGRHTTQLRHGIKAA